MLSQSRRISVDGHARQHDAAAAGLRHAALELDALHTELCSRGLAIAPPQTRFYGMRQIEVTDPDGYELCFQCPA